MEHGGLGVKRDALFILRRSKYVLANMNYVCNISLKRQLTNLSIDMIVFFKLTKLRAV